MKLRHALAVLIMSTSTLPADAPVRHVVSFKFKQGTSQKAIQEIETSFAELKSKISQIQALEWGTNVSGENLDKGFTHMWVLTFNDAAALKIYLDHPAHKSFVQLLKPSLEDAFVIDFQPK